MMMMLVVDSGHCGLWTMDPRAVCALTFVAGSLPMLMMAMTPGMLSLFQIHHQILYRFLPRLFPKGSRIECTLDFV